MNGPSQEIDQKNLISAIALSVGILMTWQYFNPPPPPVEMNSESKGIAEKSVEQKATSIPASEGSNPLSVTVKPLTPEKLIELENDGQSIKIVNRDPDIRSWELKNKQYASKGEDGSETLLELVSGASNPPIKTGFKSPELEISINGSGAVVDYAVQASSANTAKYVWRDGRTGLAVEKQVLLVDQQHRTETELRLTNTSTVPVSYALNVRLQGIQDDANAEGSMFMPPLHLYEALCKTGGGFERLLAKDIRDNVEDGDSNVFKNEIAWSGIGTRYFLTAIYANDGLLSSCAASVTPSKDGFTHFTNLVGLGEGMLQPGETVTRKYSIFMGPKKLSELSAGAVSLEDAIDFGMFHVMCKPMLWFMHIFFGFIANWGVAIILLTILVKLITMPLTIKQYRSMAAMKVVQPELKKLQDKYKEDKMRLQQEMMKLYKDHDVNPLAGCLPMVIMMPIYFALYRTIYSAVELYQAPFALWLTDLSVEDPTYITPLLLGVLMLIQMKLNPSAGDQAQQKIIMYVMPIMFTGMMLFLPSGLVVYILVNTVLGIIQQFYMYRKQGLVASKA